jgi:hypothetical protein
MRIPAGIREFLGDFRTGEIGRFRKNCGPVSGGLQILGKSLIFIESDSTRVGAHESFIKDAPGQLIELVFLERLQHASADLSNGGNLIE